MRFGSDLIRFDASILGRDRLLDIRYVRVSTRRFDSIFSLSNVVKYLK